MKLTKNEWCKNGQYSAQADMSDIQRHKGASKVVNEIPDQLEKTNAELQVDVKQKIMNKYACL